MAKKKRQPEQPNIVRAGSLTEAQAKQVFSELSAGGLRDNLSPDDVLAYAEEHPESETAKHFEWNDGAAAHQWRKQQARQIVRSIQIVVKQERNWSPPIRWYHSVSIVKPDDTTERRYVSIDVLKTREDLAAQTVQRARRELERFRRTYSELKDLLQPFWGDLEKFLDDDAAGAA